MVQPTLARSVDAGAALKGPADRLLRELGHESSVVGVARLYAPLAATLVVDEADADPWTFVSHLAASLLEAFPETREHLLASLSGTSAQDASRAIQARPVSRSVRTGRFCSSLASRNP